MDDTLRKTAAERAISGPQRIHSILTVKAEMGKAQTKHAIMQDQRIKFFFRGLQGCGHSTSCENFNIRIF